MGRPSRATSPWAWVPIGGALSPPRSPLRVPLTFPLFSILHGSDPQNTGTIGGEAVTDVTRLQGARANQRVQWREARATVIFTLCSRITVP